MPEDIQSMLAQLNRYDAICIADPRNEQAAHAWDDLWQRLKACGVTPQWNMAKHIYEIKEGSHEANTN